VGFCTRVRFIIRCRLPASSSDLKALLNFREFHEQCRPGRGGEAAIRLEDYPRHQYGTAFAENRSNPCSIRDPS
jgi:hypothetical protein